METGNNFNQLVAHCPCVHKPKLYPQTKKPGKMSFFLDIHPLSSSTKLGREQLVLSPCTSDWAVTQAATYAQSSPLSYQMPRWQTLIQQEQCSAGRNLSHPSGNMCFQLHPLGEQHHQKLYSIAAFTHTHIMLT